MVFEYGRQTIFWNLSTNSLCNNYSSIYHLWLYLIFMTLSTKGHWLIKLLIMYIISIFTARKQHSNLKSRFIATDWDSRHYTCHLYTGICKCGGYSHCGVQDQIFLQQIFNYFLFWQATTQSMVWLTRFFRKMVIYVL